MATLQIVLDTCNSAKITAVGYSFIISACDTIISIYFFEVKYFFLSQLTKLVINVFCSIPVYLYIHINVLFKCGFVLDRKKKQNPELTGSQWTTASGNFIDGQLYSHNFYCKNLIFKSLYLPLEILSPETVLQQKLVWKHF